jgi:predicted DNA-binding transcriptional regulator AlpA
MSPKATTKAKAKSVFLPKLTGNYIGGIIPELEDSQIIRRKFGRDVFGLGDTQIDKKIALGEIPKPIPICETGRASAWNGHLVNEYNRLKIARIEAARIAATSKIKGAK